MLHGWLPDPSSTEAKIVGNTRYEDLVFMLAAMESESSGKGW